MGCGCIFGLFAAIVPRAVLGWVWLFTDLVGQAFKSALLPLLGLVFLPFTTIAYVLAHGAGHHGPTNTGWLFVLAALLVDLGNYGGHAKTRRSARGAVRGAAGAASADEEA